MFSFRKSKDIITLFHKASSPASVRVATVLKQASANSTEHATEDQASDHSAQTTPHRDEFELNVTEDLPTTDQLQTILEYVGKNNIPTVIQGASSETEAMRLFKKSAEAFQRPITVDWNNGKVVVGADESKILKMLNQPS
ncbi:thioredoxin-like protein [Coniella lustricola]|uniref:Thioredoxin-like protein n=1 Tax=Coniella lustricola TaxID=2025994 RepID=A0A2T3A8J3_9PEZI|nr:thioredoxin-like protein [Coniella lustricola]